MFTSVQAFAKIWQDQSADTLKLMRALTTPSLSQAVADGHRTLGRIAWHTTTIMPEMFKYTGIHLQKVKEDDPVPSTADMFGKMYDLVSKELLMRVKNDWTDETLQIEDEMYGEKWKRGFTLWVLVTHEIHHRGQMTVLMRQAGLKVPGLFGPSYEEWSTYGMTPPVV